MAVQEIDPTTTRWAYIKAAGVSDLRRKQMHLADITGRGRVPKRGDRRDAEEVARRYDSDPSGAGARIRGWHNDGAAVVTDRVAEVAGDEARRKAYEAGKKVRVERPSERRWDVRWHDDKTPAEAIVAKLLTDPELAHEVWKQLQAHVMRITRSKNKRRSAA